VWREAAQRFRSAHIDTPELDARLLLGRALGFDAVQLVVNEHNTVGEAQLADFENLVVRRLGGEPVSRIFQEKEFYGLLFSLNADTLVPRPETELLVDLGGAFLRKREAPSILDLGTGSGCILIALLHEVEHACGVGGDISKPALEQAVLNARFHGVDKRSEWIVGSWFENLGSSKFDLIVANPPYINQGDLRGLAREVREFDPVQALEGGVGGLDAYRQIVAGAEAFLHPGGALMLEIGFDQEEAVCRLCHQQAFNNITARRDLAGHSRVIIAQN